MAAYTANVAKHATLTATTVDTVTLNGAGTGRFEVVNRDGTNPVWVTYSRSGTAPTDPTASGDDCHVLPPNSSKEFYTYGIAALIVKVLGNGGAYSVEALDG